MPATVRELLVCAGGLVTTLLAAVAVFAIEDATGIDFFGLFHCLVIPSGALAIGIVSASGYYAAARVLHQPPTSIVAVGMAVVALASQLLYYGVGYVTSVDLTGEPLRHLIGFGEFVHLYVTESTYRIRGTSVGQLGALGWLLVVVQSIGLLGGGGAVFVWLKSTPFCGRCERYFRLTGRHVRYLDEETTDRYRTNAGSDPVWSAPHQEMLLALPPRPAGKSGEPTRLVLELRRCAGCGAERWIERLEQLRRGEFQTIGYGGARVLPTGVSLAARLAELKRRG